jgi:hypothetical protein
VFYSTGRFNRLLTNAENICFSLPPIAYKCAKFPPNRLQMCKFSTPISSLYANCGCRTGRHSFEVTLQLHILWEHNVHLRDCTTSSGGGLVMHTASLVLFPSNLPFAAVPNASFPRAAFTCMDFARTGEPWVEEVKEHKQAARTTRSSIFFPSSFQVEG